jgi:hypothetical protein
MALLSGSVSSMVLYLLAKRAAGSNIQNFDLQQPAFKWTEQLISGISENRKQDFDLLPSKSTSKARSLERGYIKVGFSIPVSSNFLIHPSDFIYRI